MADSNSESSTLNGILRILRRRLGVVVLCVLLVPASALVFSLLQEKQYEASASLLFRDPAFDQKLFGTPFIAPSKDAAREAATNVELVSLEEVADRTARRLGGGLDGARVSDRVEVSAEGQSDVVSITATDPDPAAAARLANTFAREYVAFRRSADRSKIREAETLLRRQSQALPASERRGSDLRARAGQLATLEALQTGNAEVVQAARVPADPATPQPVRNTLLGAVLGLLLGIGLAFLLERLDRRVRDPKEVEETFDRPILGTVPQSGALAAAGPAARRTSGPVAEAFGMLRTNLRYFNVDRDVQTILVTSAAPGDGKSTVAWSLASAAASAGARVLLIEADLRRPSLAAGLGGAAVRGLSHLLSRVAEPREVIQEVPITTPQHGAAPARTMDVILAGAIPPNPSDLIESQRMKELLRAAERQYELIVIDTPPTSVVSDAIPLVAQVSGVVVVTRLGASTRDGIVTLRDQLVNLGAPILGVVINSSGGRDDYSGYGYADGYGYGFESQNGNGPHSGAGGRSGKRRNRSRRAQRARA